MSDFDMDEFNQGIIEEFRANAGVRGWCRNRVTASVADPATREAIWQRQKEHFPQLADYEAATDRTIPVIVLSPR